MTFDFADEDCLALVAASPRIEPGVRSCAGGTDDERRARRRSAFDELATRCPTRSRPTSRCSREAYADVRRRRSRTSASSRASPERRAARSSSRRRSQSLGPAERHRPRPSASRPGRRELQRADSLRGARSRERRARRFAARRATDADPSRRNVRARIPSAREGPRHRPRDGCVRVRDRPRKRRAPPGGGVGLLADVRAGAARRAAADDLRGRPGAHCGARARRRRARGVLRGCRRPHRALRRAGARRRARRGRRRRGRLRRVRAGARQADGLRLRARREGTDAADGEDHPRARGRAELVARGGRVRRRDLPRARAAALEVRG